MKVADSEHWVGIEKKGAKSQNGGRELRRVEKRNCRREIIRDDLSEKKWSGIVSEAII